MVDRRLPAAIIAVLLQAMILSGFAIAAAPLATTETIVLVRHGEKPVKGLGQLDCQGLNRAMALPGVIRRQFGRPVAIFAPDPAVKKEDGGQPYDYVRPLATIEPTAVAFGLPVEAGIGVWDREALQRALEAPDYRDALVVVAWEHQEIVKIARALLSGHGGNAAAVPDWKGSDFDSIYVVRLNRTGDIGTATFEIRYEGLDHQPAACPG